jgi:Spy/CpxP family protein refolding chaperone
MIVLVTGGLLVSVLVIGCTNYRTAEERADAFVEHVAWELDLNSAQEDNARQVAAAVLQMRNALRGADGERHQALHELLTAETFDAGQAQLLYEQSRQEMDQYVPRLIHAYSVFHASLTSAQRQELGERLQRMHKHHHH